jgi:hypothetical protein
MRKIKTTALSLIVLMLISASIPQIVEARRLHTSSNPRKQPVLFSQGIKKQYTDTETELINVAEATLKAENDTLVTGDSVLALKRNPKAKKLKKARKEKFEKRLEKAKVRRSAMAKASQAYTSQQTKLDVSSIQVNGDTATLIATETAILPLSVNSKPSEDAYSYSQEHRFIFEKENLEWVISSDERLNSNEDVSEVDSSNPSEDSILPPLLPAPSDPPSLPVSLINPSENQLFASAFSPHSDVVTSSRNSSFGYLSDPQDDVNFIKKENLLAQVGVSKQEIVNYAHLYAGTYDSHCQCNRSYNSSYRSFSGIGGDCTNFASQALRQGGWKDVSKSPFDALSQASRADTSSWWYNPIAQSYSWVGAPQLFEFLKSSSGAHRATREFELSKLEPGDIIQVDFAGDAYGIYHTIIVTHKTTITTRGVTGNNLLRVAYHSTNTLDRSFDDFYGDNPGAVYYAWKISSSY